MKMTIHVTLILCLSLGFSNLGIGQMAINSDGSQPDSSAMLDVSSIDKGVLIPRMTSSQRNNINNPATGLMVYDTDQNSFWYFDGTAWGPMDEQSPFNVNGGVIRANNFNHDFLVGDNSTEYSSGSGTKQKMFFDKSKGAFRAGEVNTDVWNDSSRGDMSFAAGRNTKASGYSSVAMGRKSTASGSYSLAIGREPQAPASDAIAIGNNAVASGSDAVALGGGNIASGYASTALGSGTTANGSYSITSGFRSTTSGTSSVAMGYRANANGKFSIALGRYVNAGSYGEVALGLFNTEDPSGNPNSFVLTDRLFVLGNGTSISNRSDAMIIYKNGNAKINGELEVNSLKILNGYSNFRVNNELTVGPSGRLKLDEGSWQTGNIKLTGGGGTFGFYGTGSDKLHLRTDGNLTVDGALKVGNGTAINKIKTGRFLVGNHSGSGPKTVTINFGDNFSSNPKVIVTPVEAAGGYNDIFAVTIKSVSNSSVTVNIYRIDALGAGWGQGLYVDWMATN
ncbi:MAG: hypothetical protein AAFV25_17170 [Bacteroidota bacterium]